MVFAKLVLVLILSSAATASGDTQLLCFGATWCEPCRQMHPALNRLAMEGYPIRQLDVDRYPELAKRYQVSAVPTCVLVDDRGVKIDQLNQATDYQTLRRFFAHHRVSPSQATIRGQSPDAIADARGSHQPTVNQLGLSQPGFHKPGTNESGLNQPSPGASSVSSVQTRSLASAVRLRVEDATGHSFGTGTVVHVHGQEALVLTCGHIFRESKGKGRILIQRFDSHASEPTTGTLISYDIDRDVALVSMKLKRPIEVARLASLENKIRPGDPVYSIGCNQGANPTVMDGYVNQIDKYLGPPNITASGRPVVGRSGGGLFNAQGELIGVCNAADPELDEGLYAALPRVHDELGRNGLTFIYRATEQPPIAQVASTRDVPNLVDPISPGLQPPNVGAAEQAPIPTATVPVRPETRSNSRELICVLKTEDGTLTQTYVIGNPSALLLEQLQRESKPDVR